MNQRDTSPTAKTPINQDENQVDVQRTADIRKRILDTADLSVNARNVKIITSGGRVTLRGPVNSEAERDTVVRTARDIAGDQNVDNQLEVKSP
ncbi:MAG TPA: BON domain-containing protein [Pirellulales bacterium]